MADGEDDVLELVDEIGLEEEETPAKPNSTDANAEETDEGEGDESELEIGFEGEEAAPASESESSVIREFRKREREKDRRIAELERQVAPKRIEVGDKPTLESCEYDEERFETALTDWNARKAQAAEQERQTEERAAAESKTWEERARAYDADKARLSVAGYDEAEGEVFTTLEPRIQALIMLTEKPAALVYALSKNPAKLEELSKLDLARAAMMIGKLEDKLKVTKRALPEPDRAVRGNASPGTADKELARLEKEAERNGGDRTKIAAYKRQQAARVKAH